MTSPYARSLPPLTDLPEPRRLPGEATNLTPPGEIIADSKGAIRKRLLQIFWAPALVLLGLWYVLLTLYVLGASPTFWFLSLLSALAEPAFLRAALIDLGFTSAGLGSAFLLVPAAATLLSLALVPLAPSVIAGLQPRRFLSEKGFQRAVATGVTAVLMLPPLLVVIMEMPSRLHSPSALRNSPTPTSEVRSEWPDIDSAKARNRPPTTTNGIMCDTPFMRLL